VQQEIVKTMEQVEEPSVAFRLWRETGALAVLVPPLATVGDLTLDSIDHIPRSSAGGRALPERTSNRLAALFLDVPPSEVRPALTGLRFSKHETSWVGALVDRWSSLGAELAAALTAREPGDEEVRRWLSRIGRLYAGAFLRVAQARWRAMREAGAPAPSDEAVRSLHRRMRRSVYRDPIDLGDLMVSGDDLRRMGIRTGPIYAKILHALLELVLADPARNTPEALMAEVPRLAAAFGADTPTAHTQG
jgi:tRNA nucleotidyltransferase (CCA-adding enzyme)